MASILDLSLADAIAQAGTPGGGEPYRFLVLRQITAEPLAPYLKVGGRALGIEADLAFGQFDAMVQDTHDDALWKTAPDAILVCTAPERFAPELALSNRFATRETADAAVNVVVARAAQLVNAVRQRSKRPILWLGLHRSPGMSAQLVDQRMAEFGHAALLARANREIEVALQESGPGWVVDITACAARVGERAFFDPVRWHQSATPFTPTGFRELAIEVLKYVRNVRGGIKKVLALDCDDTLWGGLAGEVGPEELDLGPTGMPGGAHRALQATAKALKERGVLLTLVSKNDPENVWRVFDTRPEMVLERDDIVAARINWDPKPDNLRALAEELNLGLDSFVFVDDQMAEIEAVRRFCPEVACLQVTERNLASIGQMIEAMGWFEAVQVTETDRARTRFYKADRSRSGLRTSTADMDSYLRDLRMVATLKLDDGVDIERAAQLCQRTNQFNMTTHRHGAADIRGFVVSPSARVISLAVRDQFGPLGDVGLAIVELENGEARVDTLLLSCRVFGRRCEDLLLAAVETEARNLGAARLVGVYRPTARNGIVARFWDDRDFAVSCASDGVKHATRELDGDCLESPVVFESIEIEGGGRRA